MMRRRLEKATHPNGMRFCRWGFLVILIGVSHPAISQVTEEPKFVVVGPEHFAKGPFAEAEVGAVSYVGIPAIGPGFGLGCRLGYDLASWLSLAAHIVGSTHHIHQNGSPLDAELIQSIQALAEAQLTYTFSRWALFGAGGMGFLKLSTNALQSIGVVGQGVSGSLAVSGGGGVVYHATGRHLSTSLNVLYAHFPDLASGGALTTTLGLRYTF